MKKILIGLATAAAGLTLLAAPVFAINSGTAHFGPIAGGSPDGGSCGTFWANDTYNLFFTVHNNGDGTYAVKTEYKDASFVTLGVSSPGACSSANHHGLLVDKGIQGNFQGWVDETVTSAVYTPSACDVPGACTTRKAAIALLFPGGTEDYSGWNFEYNSADKSLAYRHWQDKSDSSGNDVFVGDIAN